VACGNALHFLHSLRCDEPPAAGERLEAAFESKSHAFEQTSVNHIGEWMPIQDPMKIRDEVQCACDLSQTSVEDFGVRHCRGGRKVFWVACVTDDRVGSEEDARLAAQITTSASAVNCRGSVAISTSTPSAANSPANLRSRSRLRAQSSARFTPRARQRAQPEPTSPVAPTMSSVDWRRSLPSCKHNFLMPWTMKLTVRVLPVVKTVPCLCGS